jgi:hypothetical protein
MVIQHVALSIIGRTRLASVVMGFGTLMPHLIGVAVWDGGNRLPKGQIPYVLTTWTRNVRHLET